MDKVKRGPKKSAFARNSDFGTEDSVADLIRDSGSEISSARSFIQSQRNNYGTKTPKA